MKPSYENVWSSIQRLRDLCVEHGVRNLSMPLIAAGLDRLRVRHPLSFFLWHSLSFFVVTPPPSYQQWPRVKEMIHRAFAGTGIKVTIYIWDGK